MTDDIIRPGPRPRAVCELCNPHAIISPSQHVSKVQASHPLHDSHTSLHRKGTQRKGELRNTKFNYTKASNRLSTSIISLPSTIRAVCLSCRRHFQSLAGHSNSNQVSPVGDTRFFDHDGKAGSNLKFRSGHCTALVDSVNPDRIHTPPWLKLLPSTKNMPLSRSAPVQALTDHAGRRMCSPPCWLVCCS